MLDAGSQLALILAFGIFAQWLAWRLKQPSILFLLAIGLIAGPGFGVIKPDVLFGPLLRPMVTLAVGIILFEGGLSLRLNELREAYQPLAGLLGVGVLVTWVAASALAWGLLDLPWSLALLLGSILVVTGPTVVIPLLQHIRPVGAVRSILKWEGILIDPIGALLAVLVFEALMADAVTDVLPHTLLSVLRAVLGGLLTGGIFSLLLLVLLKRRLVPEHLKSLVTVTAVVGAFVTANTVQGESGLLATTLMGIILANQTWVSVKDIAKFSETLQIILISSLFIILASRLTVQDLSLLDWRVVVFLLLLVLLVRPLSVFMATRQSDLRWPEKLFIAGVAPRGIVAAAVASVSALELGSRGFPQVERLVPLVFAVIIGSILIYGFTSVPLARVLRLTQAKPTGLIFIGAHPWARQLAQALQGLGWDVLLLDTHAPNVRAARQMGLNCQRISALSDFIQDWVDTERFWGMLALTSNDELNALAALRFSETLGSDHVFQLQPSRKSTQPEVRDISADWRGQLLFGPGLSFKEMSARLDAGATLQQHLFVVGEETPLNGVLLMAVTADKALRICTLDSAYQPKPGDTLLLLSAKSDATTASGPATV